MKIAYFTDGYIPEVNGITYVVDSHAKLLAKTNKVRIYAPAYELKSYIERLDRGRLTIERYPSVPVIFYKKAHFSFVNIYKMYKSIKNFKPDVIHFHTPLAIGISGIFIARYLKIPLIATYHSLMSELLPPLQPFKTIDIFFKTQIGKKNLLRNVIWNTSNQIYDYCDVIISPVDIIKNELVLHNSKSKIVVISNGIDTNKFTPEIRPKTNFKIIYVGRLSPEKNIEIVVRSFAIVIKKVSKATLDIVGDGISMEPLKSLVQKLNLTKSVTFHGSISREKLTAFYQKADIFVTASEMEVQPLTILEAMSCSLPVVGVNKAGMVDLVKNNVNGYLVDSANAEQIADKISIILNDDKLRIKMAKESRKTAEKNSLYESVKKLEKLYNQVIKK